MKKYILGALTIIFYTSCQSQGDNSNLFQPYKVKVERGAVLSASVYDGCSHAKELKNGFYEFPQGLCVPMHAKGGYVDLNDNGFDESDLSLEKFTFSSYGNVITPITSLIASRYEWGQGEFEEDLNKAFGVKDTLFFTPLDQNSTNAVALSNAIFTKLIAGTGFSNMDINDLKTEFNTQKTNLENKLKSTKNDLKKAQIEIEKEILQKHANLKPSDDMKKALFAKSFIDNVVDIKDDSEPKNVAHFRFYDNEVLLNGKTDTEASIGRYEFDKQNFQNMHLLYADLNTTLIFTELKQNAKITIDAKTYTITNVKKAYDLQKLIDKTFWSYDIAENPWKINMVSYRFNSNGSYEEKWFLCEGDKDQLSCSGDKEPNETYKGHFSVNNNFIDIAFDNPKFSSKIRTFSNDGKSIKIMYENSKDGTSNIYADKLFFDFKEANLDLNLALPRS